MCNFYNFRRLFPSEISFPRLYCGFCKYKSPAGTHSAQGQHKIGAEFRSGLVRKSILKFSSCFSAPLFSRAPSAILPSVLHGADPLHPAKPPKEVTQEGKFPNPCNQGQGIVRLLKKGAALLNPAGDEAVDRGAAEFPAEGVNRVIFIAMRRLV